MKLPCLSIQQPFVEDIFNGHKPVENRGWTWMTDRDWETQGPVRLGIHASSNRSRWQDLTDEERNGRRSESGIDEPPFGCVVGVADLVQICRPRDLPRSLRNHGCVNTDVDNWCWVLHNPRRFLEPIPAMGQACLFYVEVPDKLVGATAARAEASRGSLLERPSSRKTQPEEASVREHCWIYWEPSFANLAIERSQVFPAADLGSFSVGKGDVVWLVTYKEEELFLTGRLKVASVADRGHAEKLWVRRKLWDVDAWPPPFPVPSRAHPDNSFRYRKPRVCVFAEPGTEEPYRLVPLRKALSQLRFQSNTRDRLTVTGSRNHMMIPQEVVNPRRLTPDSGAILEELWAE